MFERVAVTMELKFLFLFIISYANIGGIHSCFIQNTLGEKGERIHVIGERGCLLGFVIGLDFFFFVRVQRKWLI